MFTTDSEAVILRTYKIGEADKVVVFFSRREGLLRGVARGARRLKSRFGAGLEPYTKVQIYWAAREGSELVSVRRAEIVRSYFDVTARQEVYEKLERMCALTLAFAQPQQADERLYRMINACIEALGGGRAEACGAVLVYFELWLLRLGGFLPDLTRCGSCGGDLSTEEGRLACVPEGVLLCGGCSGGSAHGIDAETHRLLSSLSRKSPQKWAEHYLSGGRRACLEVADYSARLIARTVGAGVHAGRAGPVRGAP